MSAAVGRRRRTSGTNFLSPWLKHFNFIGMRCGALTNRALIKIELRVNIEENSYLQSESESEEEEVMKINESLHQEDAVDSNNQNKKKKKKKNIIQIHTNLKQIELDRKPSANLTASERKSHTGLPVQPTETSIPENLSKSNISQSESGSELYGGPKIYASPSRMTIQDELCQIVSQLLQIYNQFSSIEQSMMTLIQFDQDKLYKASQSLISTYQHSIVKLVKKNWVLSVKPLVQPAHSRPLAGTYSHAHIPTHAFPRTYSHQPTHSHRHATPVSTSV